MKKPQRNGYARIDRVKEQVMRELAELVRTELKDPRAGFITINDVEVSRDYSHATVYRIERRPCRQRAGFGKGQRLPAQRAVAAHHRVPNAGIAF